MEYEIEIIEEIAPEAIFFFDLENEVPVSVHAGGEIPDAAAWYRYGIVPYDLDRGDYIPIPREAFMKMVREKVAARED